MKIAVLLSGGVDSSLALKLLKDEGHELTAFYLKIWLEDETSFLGTCPWEEDLSYARAVCKQLEITLHIVPLQKEYHEKVVSYTIAEVKKGRTPNPDMFCNSLIKFGIFLKTIGKDFDKVATGHYAQLKEVDGTTYLMRAPDPIKDQTYFLARLTQDQLKQAIFPIGSLSKQETRTLAHSYNLPTKDRKDSQGICFLGKLKYRDFIKHYLGEKVGNLIEFETRKILGQHKGFWFFTIGQRQGIGLAEGPWYVVTKDTRQNIVYLSRAYYSADKIRNEFSVNSCNWISGKAPKAGSYTLKMRHGKHFHSCQFNPISDTSGTIKLANHDQGIAPGQFAVLYDKQTCLGSGAITTTDPDKNPK